MTRKTDHAPDLRPRDLGMIFLAPIVLVLIAWIWCYAAWQTLPNASHGTEEQQNRIMFWGTDLPLALFGGTALAFALASGIYLLRKRHWWLAVVILIFNVPVFFAVALAGFAFINFKPPDW